MSREEAISAELKRIRRTHFFLVNAVIAMALILAGTAALQARRIRQLERRDHLTLRRLDIVDEKGVSRVILASPAPPPTRFRKVTRRDGAVSGILLADATGTERGGYVTSDGEDANALLTLDAQGRQTVLLLAERDGSTLLRMWNQQKGSIVLGVSDNPFLNVNEMGKPLFTAPAANPQSTSTKPLYR